MNDDDDFEVIWQEPPSYGKHGQRIERFVELLKTKPGEWGELPPLKTEDGDEYYPSSVPSLLRKRYGNEVEMRSVSHSTNPVRVRIFARYKTNLKSV